MRKLFVALVVSCFVTACNNNPKGELETKKVVLSTDTTVKNNSSISTDTAASVQKEVTQPEVIKPVVPAPAAPLQKPGNVVLPKASPRSVPPKRPAKVEPSVTSNNDKSATAVPVDNTSVPSTGTDNNGTTSNTGIINDNGNSAIPTTTTTGTTQPQTNKGMSKATQGAVIGGVGGAVGGAIISRKKGKGAIIGGVIGAAGGYILGKKKDKAAKDSTK